MAAAVADNAGFREATPSTIAYRDMGSPVFASVEGTCSGNFVTGNQGGGEYWNIHKLTSAKKIGDAGLLPKVGGPVSFAMEASDSISFRVEDVGMDGLGTGNEIQLDFEADRLNFHGTLGSTNDSPGIAVTGLLEDWVEWVAWLSNSVFRVY